MGSLRLTQQAQSLNGSGPGPLHICYNCQLDVFVGLLTVGVGIALTLLPALGALSLLLGCLSQSRDEGIFLVVLYLVLPCLGVITWRAAPF